MRRRRQDNQSVLLLGQRFERNNRGVQLDDTLLRLRGGETRTVVEGVTVGNRSGRGWVFLTNDNIVKPRETVAKQMTTVVRQDIGRVGRFRKEEMIRVGRDDIDAFVRNKGADGHFSDSKSGVGRLVRKNRLEAVFQDNLGNVCLTIELWREIPSVKFCQNKVDLKNKRGSGLELGECQLGRTAVASLDRGNGANVKRIERQRRCNRDSFVCDFQVKVWPI